MASDIRPPTDKKGNARSKVALKPGFHLMDWMRLPLSPPPPRPISSSELAQHNSQFDCWTALHGKVYNITQYLDYHPGGKSILMKGAGKDCSALFMKYHAWVNIEGLLSKCFLGPLVDESTTTIVEGELEGGENEEAKEKEVSKEAVLSVLDGNDDDCSEKARSDEKSDQTCHSARAHIRINPGLQNIAAGGKVHDINASPNS